MEYISMLNPYSIYHLWQFNYCRNYLNKIINSTINNKEKYELLDFFNKSFNTVRSYCIFESKNSIVIIDFNLNKRQKNNDLSIISFLEQTTEKNVYLIMLHNFKGTNFRENIIYNIFKCSDFIFLDSKIKQYEANSKIASYLYQMDSNTIKLYLHEEKLLMKN